MSSPLSPRIPATLLLATRNRGKLRELSELLAQAELSTRLLSLDDFDEMPEVQETGQTFADNAILKAQAALRGSGQLTLADDSGLAVDALEGRPGVHSARYGWPEARTDAERNARLLAELAGLEPARRGACFVCVLALAGPDGSLQTFEGRCRGRILEAPRGTGGFGYDPLFFVDQLGCSYAEASAAQKHTHSHRGLALRAFVQWLRGPGLKG